MELDQSQQKHNPNLDILSKEALSFQKKEKQVKKCIKKRKFYMHNILAFIQQVVDREVLLKIDEYFQKLPSISYLPNLEKLKQQLVWIKYLKQTIQNVRQVGIQQGFFVFAKIMRTDLKINKLTDATIFRRLNDRISKLSKQELLKRIHDNKSLSFRSVSRIYNPNKYNKRTQKVIQFNKIMPIDQTLPSHQRFSRGQSSEQNDEGQSQISQNEQQHSSTFEGNVPCEIQERRHSNISSNISRMQSKDKFLIDILDDIRFIYFQGKWVPVKASLL